MSLAALRTIQASTEVALTIDDAKNHLRVTHNAEDSHIESLVAAATDWAGTYMRRIVMSAQVALRCDSFPLHGEAFYFRSGDESYYITRQNDFSRIMNASSRNRAIFLPGGFVTAINQIDYTDANGAPQTLTGPTSGTPGTDYQEDLTDDEWPVVFPARAGSWPSTQSGEVNAVLIDFQAGWTNVTLPESIRHAIRFKMADMYTIRDTADAGSKSALLRAAEDLLDPFVVTIY